MTEQLRSVIVGTAGLDVAAVAAAGLTVSRAGISADPARLRMAVRFTVGALVLQIVHFGEELLTGFPDRFPEALGLPPWPPAFFVPFNLFWIAVWVLSAWALAAGRRLALFPCWFLAIACVANGVAHPLLSLRVGGYFPGLVTSPLLGIVGVLLFRQLLLVTGEQGMHAGATR